MQSFEGEHEISYLEMQNRIALAGKYRLNWWSRYGIVLAFSFAIGMSWFQTQLIFENYIVYSPRWFARYSVGNGIALFVFLSALFTLVGLYVFRRLFERSTRLNEYSVNNSGEMRIDASGIHYFSPTFKQSFNWSKIDEVQRHKSGVLLFQDLSMHTVSANNFKDAAEVDAFVDMVAGYMNAASDS